MARQAVAALQDQTSNLSGGQLLIVFFGLQVRRKASSTPDKSPADLTSRSGRPLPELPRFDLRLDSSTRDRPRTQRFFVYQLGRIVLPPRQHRLPGRHQPIVRHLWPQTRPPRIALPLRPRRLAVRFRQEWHLALCLPWSGRYRRWRDQLALDDHCMSPSRS